MRDAAELRVPPGSIAWGALRFAVLSRLGPHGADPEALERQSWHLARWSGALIGTSGVGATFGFVGIGGTAGLEQLGATHPALTLIGLAPVVFVLGAATAGVALLWAAVLRRPRVHPLSVLVVVALTIGSLLVALWPISLVVVDEFANALLLGGMLLLVIGVVGALIVWGVTPSDKRQRAAPRPPGRRLRSAWVALAFSLALIGVIVVGLIEGLIWGIEHQAGGMPAADVYAALSDYDRVAGIVSVLIWAAVWSLGPLALILVRLWAVRRGDADHDIARLVGVLGLLGVGATVFFQGWATFSIGMSIADTVPPYTGSRSVFWFVYASLGVTAGLVGLLLALAPTRGSGGSTRATHAEPVRAT